MIKILLINNSVRPCGIQQWGERVQRVFENSEKYTFAYREVSSEEDIVSALEEVNPNMALYNYNPMTMPYLKGDTTKKFRHIKHVAMIHEGYSCISDTEIFGYYIHLVSDLEIAPENKRRVYNTDVRYLLDYSGKYPKNRVPTIGGFGFGFPSKRFDYIVETVNNEFERANIRFHIARSIYGDPDGNLTEIEMDKCRAKITKPGILLQVSNAFLSDDQVLEFLAGNDINCFFYDSSKTDGIAGSTDLALSVKRPIAVTHVPMFSHLYKMVPSICIDNSSIKEIMNRGIGELLPIYDRFSNKNFNAEFEKIFDAIMEGRPV